MSRKEYFAYGSNLNFEQMAYRCPEATAVGIAKLDGYELAFRRGYLTILPKEGASVEGLIWSVTDHDESQLDCYEGYPTFYDKETMTVTDAGGTPHEIMVYTMNAPYRDQLLPVSSRYTAVVLQGVWMPVSLRSSSMMLTRNTAKPTRPEPRPVPKNALPNANQARCAAQRAFFCNKRRNSYEEQTQNKAGLVAVAGGRNCAHKSGRSAARFCGRCRSNPETAQTATLDPDAAVLYADLPDAPAGSYIGSEGLPVATGQTKSACRCGRTVSWSRTATLTRML